MPLIAKIGSAPEARTNAFSEMRNRFAKPENLQDKAYDREEERNCLYDHRKFSRIFRQFGESRFYLGSEA